MHPLSYVWCVRSCVMGWAARRCGQMWVQGSPPHVNVGATVRACHAAARVFVVHRLPLSVIPRKLASSISGAPLSTRPPHVDRPVFCHQCIHCIPVRPQVSAKRAQRTGGAGSDRRTLVTCQPASPHEPMYHVHENSTHELPAISDAHLQAPTCCGGNIPAIPFPSIPGVSDGPGVRVHRPDNCQTGANSGLECQ